MTLLKPLYGAEPMLQAALASNAAQDFSGLQMLMGVHAPDDEALPVARKVQAAFPERDIGIVVDPARHGANGKVENLINMLPRARHDVLVFADADMVAPPGFLRAVAAALGEAGVGLVTSLYVGMPARRCLAGWLGALQIDQYFLPGALMARALGRQDCFGATMALRRAVLEAAGGLAPLARELADDAVLGRNVVRLGLRIGLVGMIPATVVAETSLGALWRHELRWARTMRALAPVGYAASVLQYPLAWALAAAVAGGLAPAGLAGFAVAWLLRAGLALASYLLLRRCSGGLATRPAIWLLPLREALSVAVLLASFAGRRVIWRGQVMRAARVEGIPP